MNYAKILLNFLYRKLWICQIFIGEIWSDDFAEILHFFERFLRKSAKKSVALANSELLLNNRPNQFRIGWFAKPMCNINVLIGEKVFWYTILTTCQLQPAMKKVFTFTWMMFLIEVDLVWPSTTLQKGFKRKFFPYYLVKIGNSVCTIKCIRYTIQ